MGLLLALLGPDGSNRRCPFIGIRRTPLVRVINMLRSPKQSGSINNLLRARPCRSRRLIPKPPNTRVADPFVFLLKFSEAVQKRWLLHLRLRQDLLVRNRWGLKLGGCGCLRGRRTDQTLQDLDTDLKKKRDEERYRDSHFKGKTTKE